MVMKLFRHLWPAPKSDLEIVLDKIAEQEEVRNMNIHHRLKRLKRRNVDKDNYFMVGTIDYGCGMYFNYFEVRFGDKDKKCTITLKKGNGALFLFTDPEEIRQIRQAVTSKYHQMVDDIKKQERENFAKM